MTLPHRTFRGEKNATEGKPEWFNEMKWTIAGRKIEVKPSDIEVLTAFISRRRFFEGEGYKGPVKRYLLRLKELLAGYSNKNENRGNCKTLPARTRGTRVPTKTGVIGRVTRPA